MLDDIKDVFQKHSFPLYVQAKNNKIQKYWKTHGRIETRTIRTASLPAVYLGWNGARQVMEIELHHARDVAFDEDRCRVRNRRKAQILAAVRNTVVALLRCAGFANITEGRECCSEDRIRPLYMILGRTE